MKRLCIAIILATSFLVASFAQDTGVFEFKLPPGWAFKQAFIRSNGLKAVLLLQDVPYEGEVSHRNVPSRLLIFDKDNAILNDISFPEAKHLTITRDDSIILAAGIEETENISVLDSHGRHLFDLSTKGRRPYPALLGNEIGLGRSEVGEQDGIVGTVSIVDGATGKEKIRFGPPSAKGIRGYSGFLPIGEDGQFLIATGATIFLRTYFHPETPLWRIDNIGGNVRAVIPLDEGLIGIAYDHNDFEAKEYLAGIVILDRHDGKVLFRQESNNPQVGLWKFLHGAVNVTLEKGDLLFTDYAGNMGVRVSRRPNSLGQWDPNRIKVYEITNKSRTDETTNDDGHIIKSKKDVLRIEQTRYVDKT